ncbi:MAG: DNA recombination protein RmuC [Pseudomonadota bacterium]
MTLAPLEIILLGLGCATVAGALVYIALKPRITSLQDENTTLKNTLDSERKLFAEQRATEKENREQLAMTFKALSSEVLQNSSDSFLKLAQENFKQLQLQSQHELTQKEKSFEGMIKPIKETLEKTEAEIRRIESERKEAHGALSRHLENLMQAHQSLQGETRNLVQALRRPEVRGQWGEMTLKRLAELAGMVEHCDFYEQETTRSEEGSLRPDMIIRMPGGREIVVDVKTPLDAYLSAVEAKDDETRNKHLQHHARKLRERIRELASKAYWTQFSSAPDFVVLFIPGEQFLNAALDIDRDLLEHSLQQKIILATPTSFVALLRAVAYGWRQESLAENAEHIRTIGEELYSRLQVFAEHLNRVGKSLESSVTHFNKAVGSFDSRILASARKFTEMGIQSKKEIEQIEQIEKTVRDTGE